MYFYIQESNVSIGNLAPTNSGRIGKLAGTTFHAGHIQTGRCAGKGACFTPGAHTQILEKLRKKAGQLTGRLQEMRICIQGQAGFQKALPLPELSQ